MSPVPRTFSDMKRGGCQSEKPLSRMAGGVGSTPGRGNTIPPAELAAMRAVIEEDYRRALGRQVPTPEYPPSREEKALVKGEAITSADATGKASGRSAPVPLNVRRKQKTKAIKEGDLQKHYETLAAIPTRDGTGYGSAMRPKFPLRAPVSQDQEEDAEVPGVEGRPTGTHRATPRKPINLVDRISSLSFLPSEEEPRCRSPSSETAKASRPTAELEEDELVACEAWERDHAHEIALSPISPGSESSEDSDGNNKVWKRECMGRAPPPYGYVPENAVGNYNSDGPDSDDPWY